MMQTGLGCWWWVERYLFLEKVNMAWAGTPPEMCYYLSLDLTVINFYID